MTLGPKLTRRYLVESIDPCLRGFEARSPAICRSIWAPRTLSFMRAIEVSSLMSPQWLRYGTEQSEKRRRRRPGRETDAG